MVNVQFVPSKYGVKRQDSDVGLITTGTLGWTSGENATYEKKSSVIPLSSATNKVVHPDSLYLLAVDKPGYTTYDLTVYTYNRIAVDASTTRDVLHTTHTVEDIASTLTFRGFLVQGLFVGDGNIKIGASLATDTGAVEISYKLYRL